MVVIFRRVALVGLIAHAAARLDTSSVLTPPSWLDTFGPQYDLGFSGPITFSHLPYTKCLETPETAFDIAILGMPFDTTTSYRPGARFGPHGIRLGSRRQYALRSHTTFLGYNPYDQGKTTVDCGDVPVAMVHNGLALKQMEVAYGDLLSRKVLDADSHLRKHKTSALTLDGTEVPRIITLGGDHTIVLPILRALAPVYGPITVIHFDSHFDTNDVPAVPPPYDGADITHGSYFTIAHREGLLTNNSIHVGIRQKMVGPEMLVHDKAVGFESIAAEDIDDIGISGIVNRVRERVGNGAVYLTLDIDVLDPAFAPATGTPEAGGYTVRELKRILRGLNGLNIIGADLVEVAPIYDVTADTTSIIAADLINDFVALFVGAPDAEVVATPPRSQPLVGEHIAVQQAVFSLP